MNRREFLQSSTFTAIAVYANSFIKFDGSKFVGDCETTTDILGPFYRPGSPVRSNFIIQGEKGSIVEFKGLVLHADCKTPMKNAKVELWHCDQKGIYDNDSSDFRYRGTIYTDKNGKYAFTTLLPVQYGGGPAHFHLMITPVGFQPLVTQIYFKGDSNIPGDRMASSPAAKRRILNVQTTKNSKKIVQYNVSIASKLELKSSSLDKLTGIYAPVENKSKKIEFFSKENTLWLKNDVYGEKFHYVGNNRFEEVGWPEGIYRKLQFTFLQDGKVQLSMSVKNPVVDKTTVYIKEA